MTIKNLFKKLVNQIAMLKYRLCAKTAQSENMLD